MVFMCVRAHILRVLECMCALAPCAYMRVCVCACVCARAYICVHANLLEDTNMCLHFYLISKPILI
jgi:hypothetical protein